VKQTIKDIKANVLNDIVISNQLNFSAENIGFRRGQSLPKDNTGERGSGNVFGIIPAESVLIDSSKHLSVPDQGAAGEAQFDEGLLSGERSAEDQ